MAGNIGSLLSQAGIFIFLLTLTVGIYAFGAFHLTTFYLLSCIFFSIYLFSSLPCPPVQKGARIPALFFLGSALYAACSLIFPVETQLNSVFSHILAFLAVWAVFSYSFLILVERRILFHTFLRILSITGISVAAVALLHWQTDNGKLFWVFAPENVYMSSRARWPFVNPNHLGHFLITAIMITLTDLYLSYLNLSDSYRKKRKRLSVFQFLTSQSAWYRVKPILILYPGLLLQLAVLFLTFSRSAGIGYLLAFFCALVIPLLFRAPFPRGFLSLMILPHLLLLFPVVVSGKVRGLFLDRFLSATSTLQGDLRSDLWEQALPLISSSNWQGLGPGGWRLWYLQQPVPLSNQFDIKFLHSDPYQYVVEYGHIGGVLMILFVMFFAWYVISSLKRQSRSAPPEIYLLSGLLGIGVASFFDFPFRVPGIQWWIAVIQGMLFCLLYWSRESKKALDLFHEQTLEETSDDKKTNI